MKVKEEEEKRLKEEEKEAMRQKEKRLLRDDPEKTIETMLQNKLSVDQIIDRITEILPQSDEIPGIIKKIKF